MHTFTISKERLMGTKKSALIIEDDKAQLWVIAKALERAGHKVLKAADGEQGLSIALTKKPDLILLDIVMPKMDGVSVLQRLRQDTWGKNVPVIILTNLSEIEAADDLSESYGDFLVKSDWSLQDIVSKVDMYLQNESK